MIDSDAVFPPLPETEPEPEGFPPHTVRALRTWCEDLPRADREAAIEKLCAVLGSLNRVALKPGVRDELADIIEEHLLPLIPEVERGLRRRPLPLAERSLHRARIFGDALRELANMHLLLTPVSVPGNKASREKATPHLQAAVDALTALAIHHWRLYQPLPRGLWRQIYGLLWFARELGVDRQKALRQTAISPLGPDSIDATTARLFVLGSTGVNALEIGDIDLLARWIADLPVACSEAPSPEEHPDLPVLRADLDTDHPPGLALRSLPAGENSTHVELGPLLEALRNQPESLDPARRADGRTLAERMLRLWSRLPTRRHSRETADEQRYCLFGLTRIQAYMQAALDSRKGPARPAPTDAAVPDTGDDDVHPDGRPATVNVIRMSEAARADSGLSLSDEPHATEPDDDPRPLADRGTDRAGHAWEDVGRGLEIADHEEPQAPIVKRQQPEHWQVEDIGAGGVRLRLQNPQQTLLIGDLVGLREQDPEQIGWTVGVLRWIRFETDDEISIGVEYLAQRCMPVLIQLFRAGRAIREARPGLFTPVRVGQDGAALFLPAQEFDHENRLVVWLNGRARVLALDAERTGTTLFTEVGCRMTDIELDEAPTDEPGTPDAGDALSLDPH
ncbi:hypothetical protein [Thioalkalivibrio sp. ALE19]|uniref:hypothetical protein n=1 Tax=Thioalkalivibrio sp. ALE19 TaxID=1266909 RepID=UPI00041A9EC1|nr:hypothetical protein [Thioalkalivibrio sp. ALE19]